jgi:replicative DNA helicase
VIEESSQSEANLPPQNIEAEESVLGAMMVSETALDAVNDVRLETDDFYRPRHRIIYQAIRTLDGRGEPIDALTVAELLRTEGKLEEIGGSELIYGLASTTAVPGNAGHYAQIVRQNALLRRLLTASQQIQSSIHGREAEPRDLVEQAESLLFNVARDDQASEFSSLGDILVHETERLEKLAAGESDMTGTVSGFRRLDEMTGGFQPGNLIVIAARPAMGKSALVCNIAENVAWKVKKPVAFFSLEMSETELAHRFIASRARIHADKLRKGQVSKDWNKVLKACNELTEAPLWIDDSSDLSMMDLRAKSRRLHASSGGLGLIIVDYIQLMRAEDPRQSRVEQVGQMSRGLKVLARELDVPVIALSQLSRAPEQRPDKVPMLSDLRESGSIEQDADIVAFIFREDYYEPETSERQGEADLIISKHRNGPIGKVPLAFQAEYPRFINLSTQDEADRAAAMGEAA